MERESIKKYFKNQTATQIVHHFNTGSSITQKKLFPMGQKVYLILQIVDYTN